MAFGIGGRIKRAAAKVESKVRGKAKHAGKKLEREGKVAGTKVAKATGLGYLAEGAKRQIDKLTPEEAAIPTAPEATPMPIPDEELSRIARRRSRARRRGGRASSILSDSETLG